MPVFHALTVRSTARVRPDAGPRPRTPRVRGPESNGDDKALCRNRTVGRR